MQQVILETRSICKQGIFPFSIINEKHFKAYMYTKNPIR